MVHSEVFKATYCRVHNLTVKLSEVGWDFLSEEFSLICAENGMDREGCFDREEEMYKYVTEVLGTDNWEVV